MSRVLAVGMAVGPKEGLAVLEPLESDDRMNHRLEAVRAHLLEMAGELAAARESYLLAARRTTSTPERNYLQSKADRLT